MMRSTVPTTASDRPLIPRLGVSRRTIQIALGIFWIIDAALQFQPKMFTQHFVNDVLLSATANQPSWLVAAMTHMANFVSHDVAAWNALFGLTQLAIGVGLLFRRTVKAALVVSFAWVASVWIFGEGMGQLLTGSASPLMGAPGAVLLYALIGVLVWPSKEKGTGKAHSGLASSAAGHGRFGSGPAVIAWSALWAFFGVLFLLPDNRTPNGLHDMIAGMSNGEPGWYAHFLNSTAHAFVGAGTWTAVVLAALCFIVAIGPLVSRRPEPFLLGGALLAIVFWVVGQAAGGILTGIGTDPNSGPLLALLALTLMPTVPAPADSPTPAAALFARSPRWSLATVAGLMVVPIAVAAIPQATSASAAPPQSGSTSASATGSMSGMGGMSSGGSGHSSHSAMNMDGMGGTGATDPNWHYTGPALPTAEVSLLTAANSTQDKGHAMQTPNCTTAPTGNQVLGATQYVQSVTAAVAKYKVLSAATAAGYIPVTPTGYPVVHYVNPAYMQQRYVMDPNHVDSLVYATTPQGPVLVAAMFLLPSQHENGPMPYGCLVQWHAHTNLCSSDATHTVVGFTPCGPGEYNARTAYMSHVWQVQVPGGPLAIDPSDLQVVEAAIQAQQQGLAPITSLTGVVSYNDAVSPVGSF